MFPNQSGKIANDLHVVFSETINIVSHHAGFAFPSERVTIRGKRVTFRGADVPPGESTTYDFWSMEEDLRIEDAWWTKDGDLVGAPVWEDSPL